MTESMPHYTLEQAKQLNRSLMEKVLNRAANDLQWKQRLLDDPEAAMREANFPETQTIEEMHQRAQYLTEDVVRGQMAYPTSDQVLDDPSSVQALDDPSVLDGPSYYGEHRCPWYCRYFTWRWYKSW